MSAPIYLQEPDRATQDGDPDRRECGIVVKEGRKEGRDSWRSKNETKRDPGKLLVDYEVWMWEVGKVKVSEKIVGGRKGDRFSFASSSTATSKRTLGSCIEGEDGVGEGVGGGCVW